MRNLIFALPIVLFSCESENKIEPGDIIIKCVIDSLQETPSISTIEPNPLFIYYTDCGEKITTRNFGIYNIGDTITYIYKKKK